MRTLISVVCGLVVLGLSPTFASEQPQSRIVAFTDSVSPRYGALVVSSFGQVRKALPSIRGVSALLTDRQAARLAEVPGVAFVEDDGIVHADVLSLTDSEVVPWGVDAIDADNAWSAATGTGVVVAVLDSGADLTHPDLSDNLGSGHNVLSPKTPPVDDYGHGAHVCGIVAASANSVGVMGVAHGARVLPIKVLDATGTGRVSDVIEGLRWAAGHGARIVNMSFGTATYSRALEAAVRRTRADGIVMVASAGNRGSSLESSVDYPARFDDVIAVGALASRKVRAEWSSSGPELDVLAPGGDIYSTYLNGQYAALSGSSMAAPHVAGAVALRLQLEPSLGPRDVQELLRISSRPLEGLSDSQQGAGMVDAFGLLKAALP